MERNTNVFKFQGSKMIVCAKGSNINKNMNMSTSFRSNLLSSTMNMPRNFVKQSSAMSVSSQRSMYYGREPSPTASIRSDFQPRNFQPSCYQKGFSQRSVYNGRAGSPTSMRSVDSSASLATDVVQALNNGTLNRQERKMIERALFRNNRRKYDFRKKAEQRRKMYFKNLRKGSGDDSGEQGSNSSLSSDDLASTRTDYNQRYDKNYKENIPRSVTSLYSRSEDIFQRDNREPYRDYAETESQNPYHRAAQSYHPENVLPSTFQKNCLTNKSTLYCRNNSVSGPMNTFSNQKYMHGQANMISIPRNTLNTSIHSTKSIQNKTTMSQFPSQKFNKSLALYDEHEQVRGKQFPNKECANDKKKLQAEHIDEHSEENDENIFLDTTVKPKPVAKKNETRQKRKAESLDDVPLSAKKKPKTTSGTNKPKRPTQTKNNDEINEFEFVKPQFPIRKSAPAKPREKLISKSMGAPNLLFNIQQEKEKPCPVPAEPLSPETENPEIEPEQSENTQLTNSDMSMRPSFMKRKLFTQTLDVTERKNNSSESLGTDSPQNNIYSALTREKHKTRKLVVSQSLFSRDVNQDDNNLLDLIHKIVPPNQVNSTITANTTKSFNSRVSGNKQAGDDKWDITSIISTCNNDSVSETYTDDEIFKVANDDKKSKPQEKPITKQKNPVNESKATNDKLKNMKSVVNSKILGLVLTRLPTNIVPKVQTPVKSCPAKKVVLTSSLIDQFWNTDVESDYECVGTPRPQKNINLQDQISSKQSNTEVRPTNSLTKMIKTTKTHELSPLAVNKNDPPLLKVLKKPTNTKMPNKTESKATNNATKTLKTSKDGTKTLKKSNNDTKALTQSNDGSKTLKKLDDNTKTLKKSNANIKPLKKLNNDTTQPDKADNTKKDTPTVTLKTRRQINLSAAVETVKKSRIYKKAPSPNKTAPIQNKTSPIRKTIKKQNSEKKTTQEKNNKTKPAQKDRNKSQNDSQHQMRSKQLEETPKSQRQTKNTKVQNDNEHINDSVKRLRSRTVDLSSSFNSDKFELTMCRTRKSRTPSKRISFNKSKNMLANHKTRNRATKA